jgi:hypothetical protein
MFEHGDSDAVIYLDIGYSIPAKGGSTARSRLSHWPQFSDEMVKIEPDSESRLLGKFEPQDCLRFGKASRPSNIGPDMQYVMSRMACAQDSNLQYHLNKLTTQ